MVLATLIWIVMCLVRLSSGALIVSNISSFYLNQLFVRDLSLCDLCLVRIFFTFSEKMISKFCPPLEVQIHSSAGSIKNKKALHINKQILYCKAYRGHDLDLRLSFTADVTHGVFQKHCRRVRKSSCPNQSALPTTALPSTSK